MKYLLMLFIIPVSFAGSPPACEELARTLQDYEKDLHSKTINSCTTLTHTQIVGSTPVKDPGFLEGKLCQDFYTIEAQLEQLKLEEAILSGINKLKTSLAVDQADTASRNAVVAREAGMRFVDGLDTAQSLEVLLGSTTTDGKFILEKLKALPSNQLLNQMDLSLRVSEICKDENKNLQNACNSNVFKPGPSAAQELIKLIQEAPSISTSQISSWQRMIAIKRKNAEEGQEDYTFSQMKQEMSEAFQKIDNKEIMSKAHLMAIQKLDQFENARGLSFVEDIASLKDTKKAKIASDKFFLLMGDAELRQQYEVQSKISVVWDNYKEQASSLSESQIADCDNAKNLYSLAKSCESHLREANRAIGNGNLEEFLDAIKASVSYADKLTSAKNSCSQELTTTEALSETCFSHMNNDLATVQDKILQLNLLKDRIGNENAEKMKFRNFALNKWATQSCGRVESPIDFCEDNTSITKNAMLTISDAMKIAVVFTPKPEIDSEVEKICDEQDETLKKQEKRLCEFFNDTTPNTLEPKKEEEFVGAPTRPEDNGLQKAELRDAWLAGGAKVLGTLLPALLPKTTPPPGINPYPYNFAPYNGGKPALGIADSIMFNARYHGAYGFYMPTPGYKPGSAFSSNVSFTGYKAASAPSSKYFGF